MKEKKLNDSKIARKIFLLMQKEKWNENDERRILDYLELNDTSELEQLLFIEFQKLDAADFSANSEVISKRLEKIHQVIK